MCVHVRPRPGKGCQHGAGREKDHTSHRDGGGSWPTRVKSPPYTELLLRIKKKICCSTQQACAPYLRNSPTQVFPVNIRTVYNQLWTFAKAGLSTLASKNALEKVYLFLNDFVLEVTHLSCHLLLFGKELSHRPIYNSLPKKPLLGISESWFLQQTVRKVGQNSPFVSVTDPRKKTEE